MLQDLFSRALQLLRPSKTLFLAKMVQASGLNPSAILELIRNETKIFK